MAFTLNPTRASLVNLWNRNAGNVRSAAVRPRGGAAAWAAVRNRPDACNRQCRAAGDSGRNRVVLGPAQGRAPAAAPAQVSGALREWESGRASVAADGAGCGRDGV